MQISARIVRNSTLRIAQFVLGLGISFFLMPFLVRHLGDRMYGLWTLVGSVLGYYGLIDFGLSSAVGRFVSRAMGRGDKAEIRTVFCTSFYLFLTLGLVTACLTWALSGALGFIVENPADLRLFRVLLIVLGLNFSFDFPVRAFSAVFTSSLRDDLSVTLMMVKTIFSTGVVVWAIEKGHGIVALAIVSVSFSVVDSLARVVIARRIEPAISVNPQYFDRTKIRMLFGYSAYTFVGNIADILCYRLDSLVTTVGVGLQAVTHFFVAGRLVELMQQSLSEGVRSMGPVFSRDEGRNDYESIRRRFRFLLKMSLYFAVFTCSMAIIYGRFFIERWMGAGYSDSYLVLVILVGGYLLRLIQLPSIPLLYAISRHKYYTYTNLFEGASNLVISVYLVEKMGIVGVALGTAIPMTLTSIFALPWYVSKCVGFNQRAYMLNIARNAAAAFAFVALGAVPCHFIARADYPALLLCLLVQTVIYWPLAARFGFTAEDRASLFRAVTSSLPFAARLSLLTTPAKKDARDLGA